MPILLAAFASLFIGLSDTFGRASSRRAESISHVATQMLTGTVVTIPLLWAIDSTFIRADVISGAVSGVLIGAGLAVVYRAMALSSAAIVAPAAAVLAALLPLGWDLVGGARLVSLEIIGCVIAIASLALTTFNPDLGDRVRQGLLLGIAGGVLFGLSIVFAVDTSDASGVWPALSQRWFAFVAMVPLALQRSVPLLLPAHVRRFGVAGGVAGALGMVCWIVGSRLGDIGTVSVVSSTYPAVIAVLATRFDEDQVRWWQAIGIAGTIAGSACIALA